MEQHLKTFINNFTKSIQNNNAAIFAGAGLSVQAGYVNWKWLLKGIATDLQLDIDQETDLISLAQYHYNENKGNKNGLSQLLIEEFTRKTSITENHKILASLPIQTYWTTNYDDLIERALLANGKTPDVKRTPQNLAINMPRRDAVVYKMHGDIALPDQAVLTKDDYEAYHEHRLLYTTALQGDLVDKTLLFIGFSFDDPNLQYILSRIRILLGQHSKQHYCFLKKVNEANYKSQEDFVYAKVKQRLKIDDLKRYSIKALEIDDYPVITHILSLIQKKVLRSSIFIAGAAKEYAPQTEEEALGFVHQLSFRLVASGYKIVSGVGYGIGTAVINGASEYVFSSQYRHLDDSLLLRPFPRPLNGSAAGKELNAQYREEAMKHAGLALFIYGNKGNGEGGWMHSTGMHEEFELAESLGIVPLPVGATGYMAEELWQRVQSSLTRYYPNQAEVFNAIEKLGDKTLTQVELIDAIIHTIDLLQHYIDLE